MNFLATALSSISLLGTVAALAIVIYTTRKANATKLQARDGEQDRKAEALDKQVVDMLTTLRAFMTAQTGVNVTVKAFIEGQTTQNEKTAELLSALSRDVRMMGQATNDGSQVIALLSEVLRKTELTLRPTEGSE